MNNDKKVVFISIVGKPNVGKSSVLNGLLGSKISIVTRKPQTTRTKITGILTEDNYQYIFIDTPGHHQAKTKLGTEMVKGIFQAMSGVDLILFILDVSSKMNEKEKELLESFKQGNQKVFLILNKIDLIKNKQTLIPKIEDYSKLYPFEGIIPISAKTENGISIILKEVKKYASPSNFYFPEDSITDKSERVVVSEIIREKILINMHDEIPHFVAVNVETFKYLNNKLNIEAIIYCGKETHKGMIIGKDGEMLKRISTMARLDIETLLSCKVNLRCWTKVKKDWVNNNFLLNSFGLSN